MRPAGPARRRAERHARRTERHAEGWSACRAARATARWPRGSSAASTCRRPRWPAACWRPSASTASASSSSGPTRRHDRRRNKLLAELAERLGVPTGSRHRQRPRALARAHPVAGRHGRGAPGRHARRDRAASSRQLSHVPAPPVRMAQRFRVNIPGRGSGKRPSGRAADLRPHRGPRLPLPRLGDLDADRQAGRAVPRSPRSATRAAAMRRHASRRSCG